MKKQLIISLVLLCVAGVIPHVRAERETAPVTKVAHINLNSIMGDNLEQSAHEWRDRVLQLQNELRDRATKIEADKAKLDKLAREVRQDDSNQKSRFMSEGAKSDRTTEALKLQRDIEFAIEQAKAYQMEAFQKIQADIFAKVEKIAEKIAIDQGWDIVLMGGGVYVSKRADLTYDVLAALNKDYDALQEAAKKAAEKSFSKAPAAA